ncbi:universal stress protein [Mycolicibacterium neoaurum]|uniref:universal stress protein n=1 Tax=Mycolicibacterium neoaurum TaxID=1795 RepID=UPI001F1F5F15|nr:universal stress protein [Mycolicibacterium neoaurum]
MSPKDREPVEGTATLLEHGIAEAKFRKTSLLVINSTRGDALADPRFAQEARIDDVERHLNESGVDYAVRQEVGVDTADELLEAMDSPDAELLVIGIRQRNPVGKLLLGSVSQHLILECAKPVLAVKPTEY